MRLFRQDRCAQRARPRTDQRISPGRNDPIADIVAKRIIEVAATTGSRDPKVISNTALRQLGWH
jgi:hypothetical protein